MSDHEWIKEFPGAVTVCDDKGVILEMNDRAARMFDEQGGMGLLGTNLLNCHPGPARDKLERIMEARQTNVYTIEKNGKWKFIYQSPWYVDGAYRGFVELVMEIPQDMPHFIRTGS
ncbi:MAG TPA: diguanylate cyclase [Deltaproteobacteria bacterium]|nr:diguanylate cyclase [Deltaproteobacteria bacterium]HPR53561.1 diguanylate cyclase [Deltaproteobacteria bacterium]HXK47648.1 diguanylate cyclase [Deltaproteobacteria bacterium]